MSKHTPGPWKEGHKTLNGTDWYGVYSGNTVIAHMLSTVGEFNEEKANAQLIAAAPELLEACKKMSEACNKYNLTEVVPEYETMIDAILKTEGKQP